MTRYLTYLTVLVVVLMSDIGIKLGHGHSLRTISKRHHGYENRDLEGSNLDGLESESDYPVSE